MVQLMQKASAALLRPPSSSDNWIKDFGLQSFQYGKALHFGGELFFAFFIPVWLNRYINNS